MALAPTATATPATTEHPATPAAQVDGPAATDKGPDELELEEALAAVEAEGNTPAEDNPLPAAVTPTPAVETAPAAASATVPIAAVQDERQKRQDAERRATDAEEEVRKRTGTALYWKGVAEGKYPDPRNANGVDAVPSPKAEIRGEMRALAAKVDAGTMSFEEAETQRQALEDKLDGIRETEIMARVQKSLPTPDNDLFLQTLTSELEAKNAGWIEKVPDDELLALVPFAKKDLMAAGFDVDKHAGTAIADIRLREAVAAKAKEFGFHTKYGSGGAENAPAKPATQMVAPSAQDLADKDALRKAAPPVPSGTSAPADPWNADRVEQMDSLDLENMSKADLARLGDKLDREAAATRTTGSSRR